MWTPYQQFARVHFPELCQERPVNSHKGTFGTVAIIGGNTGMSGAAIMAARARLRPGSGPVCQALSRPFQTTSSPGRTGPMI